jgi:hypothetical protein
VLLPSTLPWEGGPALDYELVVSYSETVPGRIGQHDLRQRVPFKPSDRIFTSSKRPSSRTDLATTTVRPRLETSGTDVPGHRRYRRRLHPQPHHDPPTFAETR